MATYKLTAFEKTGELVIDETFSVETDDEAIIRGKQLLEDKNWTEKTHRLASPTGKLLLFHT